MSRSSAGPYLVCFMVGCIAGGAAIATVDKEVIRKLRESQYEAALNSIANADAAHAQKERAEAAEAEAAAAFANADHYKKAYHELKNAEEEQPFPSLLEPRPIPKNEPSTTDKEYAAQLVTYALQENKLPDESLLRLAGIDEKGMWQYASCDQPIRNNSGKLYHLHFNTPLMTFGGKVNDDYNIFNDRDSGSKPGDISIIYQPVRILLDNMEYKALDAGDVISEHVGKTLFSTPEAPPEGTIARIGQTLYFAQFSNGNWTVLDNAKLPRDMWHLLIKK